MINHIVIKCLDLSGLFSHYFSSWSKNWRKLTPQPLYLFAWYLQIFITCDFILPASKRSNFYFFLGPRRHTHTHIYTLQGNCKAEKSALCHPSGAKLSCLVSSMHTLFSWTVLNYKKRYVLDFSHVLLNDAQFVLKTILKSSLACETITKLARSVKGTTLQDRNRKLWTSVRKESYL